VRDEDESGHVWTTLLDGYGRAANESDGLGAHTVTSRDLVDNVTSIDVHDSGGTLLSSEQMIYDERSRLVQTDKPFFVVGTGAPIYLDGNADGVVTTCSSYDPAGHAIASTDDRGRITTNSYDSAGRRWLQIDPAGNQTQWVRDANGNVTSTIHRDMVGGSPVTWTESRTLDAANRLVTSTDGNGKVTTYEQNSRGLVTKITDPMGNETINVYDDLGRRLTQSHPLHTGGIGSGSIVATSTVTQVFDINDNLLQIRDGQSATTNYVYDARNRAASVQRPGEPATVLTYNADNTVHSCTDANGTLVVYGYDTAGRLQAKTVTTAAGVDAQTTFETWSFDGMGRVASATNDLGTVSRSYDSLGHLLTDDFNGLSATQSVDGWNNVVGLDYPTTLHVAWDIDPILDQTLYVKVNGPTYFSFVYDGNSRLSQRTTTPPGGAVWDLKRTYDGGMRLVTHRHKLNGASTAIAGWNYSYFDSSVIATVARQHQNLSGDQFFSDSLYEETRVQKDVPRTELGNPATTSYGSYFGYTYDLAGNRLLADANGTTTAYVPNSLQQYASVGSASLTYDANGNLLSDGRRTYVYDYSNRLVSVRQGATTIADYRYDALGRRYEKTVGSVTTRAVWMDDAIIEERETVGATTTVRQFVWGRELDELLLLRVGGVDYFPLADHQQSVSHLLDASANVVESYTFDPYGKPTIKDASAATISASQYGNPALYAGRAFDVETGLYYNRARYYHPGFGRFLTRDPSGFAGGVNLYAYVGNGPINARDPYGLDKFKDLVPSDEHGKNAAVWSVVGGGLVIFGAGVATVLTGGLAAIIGGGIAALGGVAGVYVGVEWANELSDAMKAQLGKNIQNFADQINTFVLEGRALATSVGSKPGTHDLGGGITVTVDKNGDKTVNCPDGSSMTYHKDGTADGTDGRGDTVHVDKDGTITTTLEDGTTIVRHPDGSTTTTTPDGTVIDVDRKGKITKIKPSKKKEEEDKGKKENQYHESHFGPY
jgi:RHS repeat-associated protein